MNVWITWMLNDRRDQHTFHANKNLNHTTNVVVELDDVWNSEFDIKFEFENELNQDWILKMSPNLFHGKSTSDNNFLKLQIEMSKNRRTANRALVEN